MARGRWHYLIVGVVLAVLAWGLMAAGAEAQGGIDVQSSLTASATSVEVGDQVTFTIEVVNSSNVNAATKGASSNMSNRVSIGNQIPEGTKYVSVDGEARVITETARADSVASLTTVADGAKKVTDPQDVTYVVWEGNVESGADNAISFDLVLEVTPDAGPVVTDTVVVVVHYGFLQGFMIFEETATVQVKRETSTVYLPMITGGSVESS